MSVRLVCTERGIGRLNGDCVHLVRTEHEDLGAALAAGVTLEAIAQSPVVEEVGLDDVTLRVPVARPRQIWAVGLNYRAHMAEIHGGIDLREPFIFPKAP